MRKREQPTTVVACCRFDIISGRSSVSWPLNKKITMAPTGTTDIFLLSHWGEAANYDVINSVV